MKLFPLIIGVSVALFLLVIVKSTDVVGDTCYYVGTLDMDTACYPPTFYLIGWVVALIFLAWGIKGLFVGSAFNNTGNPDVLYEAFLKAKQTNDETEESYASITQDIKKKTTTWLIALLASITAVVFMGGMPANLLTGLLTIIPVLLVFYSIFNIIKYRKRQKKIATQYSLLKGASD